MLQKWKKLFWEELEVLVKEKILFFSVVERFVRLFDLNSAHVDSFSGGLLCSTTFRDVIHIGVWHASVVSLSKQWLTDFLL